jgi:hypothetical protein
VRADDFIGSNNLRLFMENQHRKITGYRELSEVEINLMNEIKELAVEAGIVMDKLVGTDGLDHRSVALAKTNLQQGFMWAIRAVAQPTTFG